MDRRLRRDVVAAVLLSAAAATVADMRPPALDDATGFIVTAVARHHAAPSAREYTRGWTVAAEFDACAARRRTAHEVLDFGAWQPVTALTRWEMSSIDGAAIGVTTEVSGRKEVYVVTLPCLSNGDCVRTDAVKRRDARFEFTSSIIAQRVAAAFRYAADLCTIPPAPSEPTVTR